MRKRRKIRYYVQNWNKKSIWWTNGKWAAEIVNGKGGSSSKICFTLRNALRNARRIFALGGEPLISRSMTIKGRRQWQDFKYNKEKDI